MQVMLIGHVPTQSHVNKLLKRAQTAKHNVLESLLIETALTRVKLERNN